MKALMLSLLMEMITCFLEGPLVVIWIFGFDFIFPLMMLLTWSIFLALSAGNVSLILRMSDIEACDLEA